MSWQNTWLGSLTKGEWAKGLTQMGLGSSVGGNIFDAATGAKPVGKAAAQVATDVGSVAVSFIPGIGPVAAAGIQAAGQAANAAVQGGGAADIALAGVGGALGGVGGSLFSKAGSAVKEAISKGVTKVTSKGVATGAAAEVSKGYLGTLPGLKGNPVTQAATGANTIEAPALKSAVGKATGTTPAIQQGSGRLAGLKTKANTVRAKAGKVVGQYGAQGALSVASAVMGAKQASDSNKVAQQSLLFQQQTYKEQKAEVEKNKAKLKQDAWSDYSSASLFGEQLYGSDSNNTLLTSYHTNGTGNAGNYSLIGSGVTTSRKTDLT